MIIISNSRVDRLKIALSTENAMEDSNLLQVKCDVKVLRFCVSTKMCVSGKHILFAASIYLAYKNKMLNVELIMESFISN